MKADIDLLEDIPLIRIRYHHDIGPEDFNEIWNKAFEMIHGDLDFVCVADTRSIEDEPSIKDIFRMPKMLDQLGIPKSARIAVIVREDAPKGLGPFFFETICRNRGYKVKVFRSEDEAMTWVKKS